MSLALKQALSIAGRYAGTENNLDCAVLRDGGLMVTDTFQGVALRCDAVTVDLAVNVEALKRIVNAIKGPVTLGIAKGRKLTIKGDGVSYTLQAVPDAKVPGMLDGPSGGWSAITASAMEALCAVAPLAATEGPLRGVCLTPGYVIVATPAVQTVLWETQIVPQACVVRGDLFRGLDGGAEIAIADGKLWIRQEDQTRWARTYDSDWPDSAFMGAITMVRAAPGRRAASVDIEELAALAKRAQAIASKADVFRLGIGDTQLTLSGVVEGGAYGTRSFDGQIAVTDVRGAIPATLPGVSPYDLEAVAAVMGKGQRYISIGDASESIRVWGGTPALESLITPRYLA